MKKAIKSVVFALLVQLVLLSPVQVVNAATVDAMRNKVLSIAQLEVGYTGTSSYSKYGEWYGYQGGWCTTFVLWCFNETDKSLGTSTYGSITPKGGNCNSMIDWFNNQGIYHKSDSAYTPKKGDLVFFDWSGNGSSQHVGFVQSVSGSTVYTIEGNCSGKVKERKYTSSGSKPYNNISAIMGYAAPKYSAAASGTSKQTTTKQKISKKTSAKQTTTKKATTQKTTLKKPTTTTAKAHTTTNPLTKTTTTSEVSLTEAVTLEKLELRAAANSLQIGDSVDLEYEVKPSGAPAVVGYFCDEENIVEISSGGKITAIGSGKATVVVCANNDLYSQYDFTVTGIQSEVTAHSTMPQITQSKPDINESSGGALYNIYSAFLSYAAAFINNQTALFATSAILAIMGVMSIIYVIRKNKTR